MYYNLLYHLRLLVVHNFKIFYLVALSCKYFPTRFVLQLTFFYSARYVQCG